MVKRYYRLVMVATMAVFISTGCSLLVGDPGSDGADGSNGTNGTNGTDGANTGVLGDYFYLEGDIIDPVEIVYYGGAIGMVYSLSATSPDRPTATMTIINNSWTPLTLSGTPTIEDLGGWYLDNPAGTRIYGAVPSISITPPAAGVVDYENPITFEVVFAPVALPQDSRSRKRYRIALQDAEGTHYSFDFEVEAVIIC